MGRRGAPAGRFQEGLVGVVDDVRTDQVLHHVERLGPQSVGVEEFPAGVGGVHERPELLGPRDVGPVGEDRVDIDVDVLVRRVLLDEAVHDPAMSASSPASTKFSTLRNPLRSQAPISSTVSAFMLPMFPLDGYGTLPRAMSRSAHVATRDVHEDHRSQELDPATNQRPSATVDD